MSGTRKRKEELLEKLVLDAKALVLLERSDEELRSMLQAKFVESDDESLRKFAGALRSGGPPKTGRLVVVAVGEMLLASLLVLAGAAVLIPTLAGIDSPAALVRFFAEGVYGVLEGSALLPYVPLMEFAAGALLMLSAFYTLRHAALALKEAGLAIEPGES